MNEKTRQVVIGVGVLLVVVMLSPVWGGLFTLVVSWISHIVTPIFESLMPPGR
jgi:hypothetical protein